MRIRILFLALLTMVSVWAITACSSEKDASDTIPQPSNAKEKSTGSESPRPGDLLRYRYVSLTLKNDEYAVFGTSHSKPYVQTNGEGADIRACCMAGGEMKLYFVSQDREAYQVVDAHSRQDCVASENSAPHVTGGIAFSDLKRGQRFCVLNHAYSDPKENDVDLVTVREVSPKTGVIKLTLTGWGN
ncbi:hypothetical protein [Streptomyces sp. NK08204]|uniref:hypothetical protein n=1 Tax=Streptomyces sp. NK08204 TaxID=2873260 RepID=UPI001CEDFE82|nr:hypothetical protein [Streptomyces sp. NK08204]